jgi:hypothetical protein
MDNVGAALLLHETSGEHDTTVWCGIWGTHQPRLYFTITRRCDMRSAYPGPSPVGAGPVDWLVVCATACALAAIATNTGDGSSDKIVCKQWCVTPLLHLCT